MAFSDSQTPLESHNGQIGLDQENVKLIGDIGKIQKQFSRKSEILRPQI